MVHDCSLYPTIGWEIKIIITSSHLGKIDTQKQSHLITRGSVKAFTILVVITEETSIIASSMVFCVHVMMLDYIEMPMWRISEELIDFRFRPYFNSLYGKQREDGFINNNLRELLLSFCLELSSRKQVRTMIHVTDFVWMI